jgi:TPR repeat protein
MLRTIAACVLGLVLAAPVMAGMEDALLAYSQRDYETALQEFRPLALQGDSVALYKIGLMHFNGQGVPQDYAEALEWYMKAAEQGDAAASFSIARMYSSGQGVQQDYVEALEWYKIAAELGHGDAQAHLGIMYFVGMEVSRDHIEALKWLQIASSLGVDVAPRYGDIVAKRMTELQIDEAQRLANDWLETHLQPK